MAERLGFPADVVARARALAPESALATERLIADLHERRLALDAERERLAEAVRAAEKKAPVVFQPQRPNTQA